MSGIPNETSSPPFSEKEVISREIRRAMWRDLVEDVGIDVAKRQWPKIDPDAGGPGYVRNNVILSWTDAVTTNVFPDKAPTPEEAEKLRPKYATVPMVVVLEWHKTICHICREASEHGRPAGWGVPARTMCPEWFEIIQEYSEYEGYAVRGEG